MRNRTAFFFIAICVAVLINWTWAHAEETSKPKDRGSRRGRALKGPRVGSIAPDFTLPDLQGKRISLSDFRGKRPVVLEWGSIT